MKLIDQYVYAVKEHLPHELRDDIGKELCANIEDMLPEDYTEEDVYQVLMELGSPWKLANEYNTSKQYLIGPGYYNNYIAMLKLVIGICVSVTIGISLFVWIIEFANSDFLIENIAKLIGSIITSAVAGALQGAFWVTLVFVILERSGVEAGYLPFFKKEWTPEDLPEIPLNDKQKISRVETIFSMFCTILFTALIYFQPHLIAFYRMQGDKLTLTPLFVVERLDLYLPVILILAFIQLVFSIWKYITGTWNIPLMIINAVNNVAICILMIVFMSDKALLNPTFTQAILNSTNASELTISNWLITSKWIFVIVFVGICVWDSVITFFRYFKTSK